MVVAGWICLHRPKRHGGEGISPTDHEEELVHFQLPKGDHLVPKAAGVQEVGILKHRRTNLPSTTDKGIYYDKIAAKFSGALNSYSPSAEGA
jgi:hypothetical protein